MCGLVGIINKRQQEVDLPVLTQMADTLNHRGPDDEGHFIENSIGFYFKRLSIIDLEQGHQPMSSGDFTIVFNGEIYNYVELREELKQKGFEFKTKSDTEVIIKMYQAYGLEAINKLNGMFAFVLFDKKNDRIIAARDHFGIKPLYYYSDEEQVLFASEIKALFKHPSVKAKADNGALHYYLTFQFQLGERTMFEGIKKLLPGHYLILDLNTYQFVMMKYWEPNFKVDFYHTEEYFVDKLKHLLEDTIRIQLRSDVPLGSYLSGGIDSSVISILAARQIDKPLQCFTGGFHEGKEFNEVQYAKASAEKCKAVLHEVYPTEQEFIDLLPKLIYHMDEPVAGPGLFPQYIVSRLASQHVTVVLSGQGGDEIFGGYARYVIAYLEQAIKGGIFQNNEEKEHIVSLQSILANLPHLKSYIPMMKEFMSQGAFDPMDKRYFHLLDRSENNEHFFSEDFKNSHNKESIFQQFSKIFNHPDTLSYYNKMTHFDLFGSMPGLLHVEDRVSMAVSLESRVPLLDRRIVDLVSTMPAGMKFKGAEMKYLFKKSVAEVLPDKVLNRKDKMGFPVPLHIWARNKAGGFIKDILLSDKSRNRGIFNAIKIEELIQSERPFGRILWGALCLELWFNEFIDN
ncbi:asparagine synthase (glutamine-hydrolyzing) [Bacteroidota bacterium]